MPAAAQKGLLCYRTQCKNHVGTLLAAAALLLQLVLFLLTSVLLLEKKRKKIINCECRLYAA